MGFSTPDGIGNPVNLARGVKVSASSHRGSYMPEAVVDGVVSDNSRWLAMEDDSSPWVELVFSNPVKIGAVDVFSGWGNGERSILDAFDLMMEVNGKWMSPDSGRIRNNTEVGRRVEMDGRTVSKLRLCLVEPGAGRIYEIAVYESKESKVSEGLTGTALPQPKIDRSQHQVAVNQVGYVASKPKRFSAPLSPDGTQFAIRAVGDSVILYRGVIKGEIGDFSEFRPSNVFSRYVIDVRGGSLKNNLSDPFLIREDLYETEFWQPAADFLIDSRAVIGTHPSAYGGCPWRDGTYYDAIIPSLVLFYLAEPLRIEAMPHQIDWQADKNRVLSSNFKFDARNPSSQGVMDAVRNYYDLEPPNADAPDVVKLIHWGAGYYIVNPATHDPSGDPDGRKIHSQTVEQVAYVVWAWPMLKQWLPESFYEKCRDFCFENWEPSLEIDAWWDSKTYLTVEQVTGSNPMGGLLHPYKGRHAPGHSIVPNLLMHEVAKREDRADADQYLDAAVEQAEWIIKNIDWNDPRTTKGHRMSEHRTIPNLVWLLQKYPKQAPDGLKEKITDWAEVAVSRSNNLWDFRRYDLNTHWTIPKLNDVGNSVSLPAIAISASWVVEDASLKHRLEELAYASVDHVFGRNPRLAAAPNHPEMGFPEIERGWPIGHRDNVCARLELCRGSIATLPGTEMYPFNPEGRYRHAEGWVNYGASWCISLSYLKFDAEKTVPHPEPL